MERQDKTEEKCRWKTEGVSYVHIVNTPLQVTLEWAHMKLFRAIFMHYIHTQTPDPLPPQGLP